MIPFMTEDIYQNLVRSIDQSAPESIHLCDFPTADDSYIDKDLESNMAVSYTHLYTEDGMMRRGRQILAAILLLAVMCACTETTVLATEPDAAQQTEELSEEQKAEQAAYEMKVESNDWKNWPQGPGTYGEAAIVMEVGTGAILYAKNIDSHQYPASITKVLTALVALENGQLEDPVTFSHDSVAFPVSYTHLGDGHDREIETQ